MKRVLTRSVLTALLSFIILPGAAPAFSQTTNPVILELVKIGSTWRYFNEASGPGPGWRNPDFADSGWKSGPAQLGYGDGDERTDTGAPSYGVTVYFRHTFEISSNSLPSLLLRLVRDDGAIVYINGQQAVVDNM